MLRFLLDRCCCCCCCCFGSSHDHSDERQPLLHSRPSEVNGAESARLSRPAHSDVVKRIGKLVVRRVCVAEVDQRFVDMAETFNEQQERYEAMVRHIKNLQESCNCSQHDSLSFAGCVRKIRAEQESTYRVSIQIKGYDFSLSVVPVGSKGRSGSRLLPPGLQFAQNELKCTSECAKITISKGTALQELIGWLLRSQERMMEQVKAAAETYQEQGRLLENLKENVKELKRAKELAQDYRKQAAGVFTEAAEIAGDRM